LVSRKDDMSRLMRRPRRRPLGPVAGGSSSSDARYACAKKSCSAQCQVDMLDMLLPCWAIGDQWQALPDRLC
jgi:hypothetical protein